jgi:diaminopimelate epimerase
VLPLPKISAELARQIGPLLETHLRFPNRTNVQFMKVLDRKNIQIEIWERGAGYTLASGSSSSAAAAVAHRLGLCDREISVHMPGGVIEIEIGDGYAIEMTGPVTKVSDGVIAKEMFSASNGPNRRRPGPNQNRPGRQGAQMLQQAAPMPWLRQAVRTYACRMSVTSWTG